MWADGYAFYASFLTIGEELTLLWQLLLQFLLIGLNAVFACAEIAVLSVNDQKLAKMAEQGNKKAVRLARLTSQPARFLATIQVAITLSGFLGSAFAADNFSDMLVDWLVGLGVGISPKTLNSIAVILITIILSYFTLVLGELVPKRVAMKKAESLALGMSALISFISKLFAPIVWLLTVSTNALLRLFGIDPNADDEEVTEEEIRLLVDAGGQKGAIDHEEQEMIQNVFEFDDISIEEIATHRTDVDILWLEDDIASWETLIHQTRHSFYPVCGESVDDVVGVLNVKDFFRLKENGKETILADAVKPAYFVPETVRADVIFRNMKKSRSRFAVVLDEYGGMHGIVTMNDLLELLVGELEDGDELPQAEPDVQKLEEGVWKIRGTVLLDEVSKTTGVSLDDDGYDTLGGLIFGLYGSIPEDGSQITVETDQVIIQVLSIKEHRVEQAVVTVKEPEMSAIESAVS